MNTLDQIFGDINFLDSITIVKKIISIINYTLQSDLSESEKIIFINKVFDRINYISDSQKKEFILIKLIENAKIYYDIPILKLFLNKFGNINITDTCIRLKKNKYLKHSKIQEILYDRTIRNGNWYNNILTKGIEFYFKKYNFKESGECVKVLVNNFKQKQLRKYITNCVLENNINISDDGANILINGLINFYNFISSKIYDYFSNSDCIYYDFNINYEIENYLTTYLEILFPNYFGTTLN